jgi:hypothetical protein
MKTMLTRVRYAAILSSMMACAAVGCAGNVEGEDAEVSEISAALEQENGGLTTADEAPSFGAASEYVEVQEPETTIADTMAADPQAKPDLEAPNAVRVKAVVLWGQIPGDKDTLAIRVWDGKLSINRGAMLVRRTIRFEEKTDALLPRKDKRVVEFTSKTMPHHDGLRLEIIDPAPEKNASEPLTLSYEDKNGKVFSVPVASLLDGPKTKVVDSYGNRVVAMARARAIDPCEHGTLGGKWHPLIDGPKGVGKFRGVVRNDDGAPIGHMKGIYGHKKNGQEVFFGKYINSEGKFRGIFRGTYEDGRFEGRWISTTGDKGGLGGMYHEDRPGKEIGGHYVGRWAETTCKVPMGKGELKPHIN